MEEGRGRSAERSRRKFFVIIPDFSAVVTEKRFLYNGPAGHPVRATRPADVPR
jgi:isopentenyldiphosphate isomerase